MKRIIAIAILPLWLGIGWSLTSSEPLKTLPYIQTVEEERRIEDARLRLELEQMGLHLGSGLVLSGGELSEDKSTRVEALTNELGIVFVGGPMGGTRIEIGSTISTLSTNVIYGDNSSSTSRLVSRGDYATVEQFPIYATERRWITNVIRTFTLTFPWRGKTNVVTDEEIVWGVTNHQYLKTEWSAQPPESDVWKSAPPSRIQTFGTDLLISP